MVSPRFVRLRPQDSFPGEQALREGPLTRPTENHMRRTTGPTAERNRGRRRVPSTWGLVVALVASAAPTMMATPAAVAAAGDVVSRSGDLTDRPAGLPSTSNPAQTLVSARVVQDLVEGTYSATVTLAAAPPGTESAEYEHGKLVVSFGTSEDGVCLGDVRYNASLAGDLDLTGFERRGDTYTLHAENLTAFTGGHDCAFVAVTDADDLMTVDALVGTLTEEIDPGHADRLHITGVRHFGSAGKPLRLTRGSWTTLDVQVRQEGGSPGDVAIKGGGKGLKVKTVRTSAHPGLTESVRVRVKLVGKQRRTTLRLTATGAGRSTTTKVKVRRLAPKRPVAGRHRTKNGTVSFKVRGRRIVGFRATMLTQCGVHPEYRYVTQTWRFPKTKLRKDGTVERVVRRKNARFELRVRLDGRRARGTFHYQEPGGYCHASTTFTTRRAGK